MFRNLEMVLGLNLEFVLRVHLFQLVSQLPLFFFELEVFIPESLEIFFFLSWERDVRRTQMYGSIRNRSSGHGVGGQD
jgi:hypothetical protein